MTLRGSDLPFLAWLLALAPGRVTEDSGVFTIEHQIGENSTLWKRTSVASPYPALERLVFYADFDGADLFGSTFKVRSLFEARHVGQVPVVGTVRELIDDLAEARLSFPETCTPFMSGTQFEYGLAHASGAVLEYDLESDECGAYASLEAVVEEWFGAVHHQVAKR